MEEFLAYFGHLSTWIKGAWILFFLIFFWIIEGYYSFYKSNFNKWKHAKTNLLLLIFVILINSFFGIFLTFIDIWLKKTEFGILNILDTVLWKKVVLSIIILVPVVTSTFLSVWCTKCNRHIHLTLCNKK